MTQPRFDFDRDVLLPALTAASESPHAGCAFGYETSPLCDCHVGKARLALSGIVGELIHGHPTSDEMSKAIGSKNWVIARRSERIVRRYGDDVVCLTSKQYEDAEQKAWAARAARLGVRWPA